MHRKPIYIVIILRYLLSLNTTRKWIFLLSFLPLRFYKSKGNKCEREREGEKMMQIIKLRN